MNFNKFNYVRSRYYEYFDRDDADLYLCANKKNPCVVWERGMYVNSPPSESDKKNYYLYKFPNVIDFTENIYEQLKLDFIKFVKEEQIKAKVNNIEKDFQ